jgi:hypothetical protein
MKKLKTILLILMAGITLSLRAEETTYEFTDPNYTRLFFTPTAETIKKGRAYVGVTEFLLFQYAYGITDSAQMGVTVFPFFPSAAFVFKNEIVNSQNNILSLQFGIGTPLIFSEDFSGVGFMGGLIYSNGTRDKRFTISSTFIGTISNADDTFAGAIIACGFETRTSERVKWLFELSLVPVFIDGKLEADFPRGITIGPRFFGKNFAADLGFTFPLQRFGNTVYFILPVFNFAYHF